MLLGKALIFLHDIINFKNIVDERKEKQDHIPHAPYYLPMMHIKSGNVPYFSDD